MPNSFGKHSGLHTAPGDLLDDVLTISSDLKQELLLCVRRVLRESIASSAGGRVLKYAWDVQRYCDLTRARQGSVFVAVCAGNPDLCAGGSGGGNARAER